MTDPTFDGEEKLSRIGKMKKSKAEELMDEREELSNLRNILSYIQDNLPEVRVKESSDYKDYRVIIDGNLTSMPDESEEIADMSITRDLGISDAPDHFTSDYVTEFRIPEDPGEVDMREYEDIEIPREQYMNHEEKYGRVPNRWELANKAAEMSDKGLDDYQVGCALHVEYDNEFVQYPHSVYCGFNINLSGMQVKTHAEQMATFNFLMDYTGIDRNVESPSVYIRTVMVHTSEDDKAHRCGHCFQVLQSVADHIGQDLEENEICIVGCSGQTTYDGRGNPDGVRFNYETTGLSDELNPSYIHRD